MVVPEDFPSEEFKKVVPNWGWVRVPGIGPGWSLALARAISRDLILRNRAFFLEVMDIIPGDPSGPTIQDDGSIRQSGVHNWVSTWMGTLLQDTICCLLLGPSYLTRLEIEGARDPDSRDTITIPHHRHATSPPGVFREAWVRGILVDLYFEEPAEFEPCFLEIMDPGFDGQIPRDGLYRRPDGSPYSPHQDSPEESGRREITPSHRTFSGSGPVDRSGTLAGQWASPRVAKERMEKLVRRVSPRGSISRAKTMVGLLLPGRTHRAEEARQTPVSASQLWAQGIQDRAIFLPPRGKRHGRKAWSASL